MGELETRALRADATRNRDQLLKVATRVFVSAGTEPSMRAIAREAGVGIATLYRHFPTRESLVEAVYRDQVARLTAGARELLAQLPPPAALRRWMDLFGDWISTKNGMLGTLLAMIESGERSPMPRRRPSCSRLSTTSSTPAARRASSAPTSPPKTSLPASSASSPWPARPSTTPGQVAC